METAVRTDEANLAVLRDADLFTDVSPETLAAIAAMGVERTVEEGDPVYEIGADAREVFIVDSGRVRFTLGVGNRIDGGTGSILTHGNVFGWAALLQDQPRRVATATCLESTRLLVLDGARLLAIFEKDTEAGYRVMRALAAMIARNFMETSTS